MSPQAPRRAGLMVPLFSAVSSRSWGIGEIGDIAPLAEWLAGAGLRVLQLLPINELPPHETSPYSAMSAMAIDPQFITLPLVDEFQAAGGVAGLDLLLQAEISRLRGTPGVDYRGVRTLKHAILRQAYRMFVDGPLAEDTARGRAFREYAAAESWWLDDYALFRALHVQRGEQPWTEWPEPLKRRQPAALAAARTELGDEIGYRTYLQWIAHEQWRTARRAASPVTLFGDLPFMVALDSADVWARQDDFRLDTSVGVPPDAFSAEGQDWKLPAYDWPAITRRDFEWLRHRARRNADLFGGYRVDHLVGYYRTYFRSLDGGPPQFSPPDEPSQTAQGERVLAVYREAGAEIIAEDLGTVPDFVRASLARLEVPGCKVMRWERAWHTPGEPFIDPADYPVRAMATSGTHDTEPMAVWWRHASPEERAAVLAIPSVGRDLTDAEKAEALARPALSLPLQDAILRALIASPATLVILPFQDAFGLSERINQPSVVDEVNWTWRMPWPSDRLPRQPEAMAAARQLRSWTSASGR